MEQLSEKKLDQRAKDFMTFPPPEDNVRSKNKKGEHNKKPCELVF